MSNETNREMLGKAKILGHIVTLTGEQERAIESLTKEEVAAIISAKDKLEEQFPMEGKVAPPIQHHH